MSNTKVIVNGATGRMGSITVGTIIQADDFNLVGQLSSQDSLKDAINDTQANIVIDFT
ncbi:MAG: 4-hydroxy-tetrahydrodipicolinate reductase, partial [Legionellales bacterium]|nr:4-hydroxy-tetrahydrodipicolinate reductase [Legionellales bacterium]